MQGSLQTNSSTVLAKLVPSPGTSVRWVWTGNTNREACHCDPLGECFVGHTRNLLIPHVVLEAIPIGYLNYSKFYTLCQCRFPANMKSSWALALLLIKYGFKNICVKYELLPPRHFRSPYWPPFPNHKHMCLDFSKLALLTFKNVSILLFLFDDTSTAISITPSPHSLPNTSYLILLL